MRPTLALLLGLLVRAQALAETRLDQLLSWQKRSYAPAWVSGGFYDPRGVSRYRSSPGLHLGYDIAMPAGAPVLAAWSGQVEALVLWAEGEWGVAVRHPDGTLATYGHVRPSVEVGRRVEPGTCLGWIARDHLDVKMRDATGAPLDYAQIRVSRTQPAPAPPPWLESERQRLNLLEQRLETMEKLLALGLAAPNRVKALRNEVTERRCRVEHAAGPGWSPGSRRSR